MRKLLMIFISFVFIGCNRPVATGKDSIAYSRSNLSDSITQILISSSTSDFLNQNHAAIKFQEAYMGQKELPDGQTLFCLRGEFQKRDEQSNKWLPFVTIKTSGYELYIGNQAVGFFQDSAIVWDKENNMSGILQSKFDSTLRVGGNH